MLKKMVKSETLPAEYLLIFKDNCIQFHYIYSSTDLIEAPTLLISVIVAHDLKVHCFIHKEVVPKNIFQNLIPSGSISIMSQLLNLLGLFKSLVTETCVANESQERSMQLLMLAVNVLQQFKEEQQSCAGSEGLMQLIPFIMIEQLQLLPIEKHGRRYSINMMKTAFLWQLASSALYKKLRLIFALPSVRQLENLSTKVSASSGVIDTDYLQLRTKELTNQEKIVNFILNEVYVAERVEYSNGSFLGLTDDGTPAKTVLAFMVQSVCSK